MIYFVKKTFLEGNVHSVAITQAVGRLSPEMKSWHAIKEFILDYDRMLVLAVENALVGKIILKNTLKRTLNPALIHFTLTLKDLQRSYGTGLHGFDCYYEQKYCWIEAIFYTICKSESNQMFVEEAVPF